MICGVAGQEIAGGEGGAHDGASRMQGKRRAVSGIDREGKKAPQMGKGRAAGSEAGAGGWGCLGMCLHVGALPGLLRLRPQLLRGPLPTTSAASEREVAIAVLLQLLERAVVRDKTARTLALCSLTPRPSYSGKKRC